MVDSLVRWFVVWFVGWFVDWLARWFVGSLFGSFVVSLFRWFVGSLVRWLVGSLIYSSIYYLFIFHSFLHSLNKDFESEPTLGNKLHLYSLIHSLIH